MNKIAYVFSQAPHGNSTGRETLDAVLATAALSENIALFFIGDGIFQLLAGQKPTEVMVRDYIVTFGVLPLYDIEHIYGCQQSAILRGIAAHSDWILPLRWLEPDGLKQQLLSYDKIINL